MALDPTLAYLDVDDEITSAAERIRAAAGGALVLVLPAGSVLGTSRLNFRLLAREAERHGVALTIVSPEAPTRTVADAAGIRAVTSVAEAEAAAAGSAAAPAREPTTRSVRSGGALRGSTGIGGSRPLADGEPARAVDRVRGTGAIDRREPRTGVPRTVGLAAAGVVALAIVVGVGGYAALTILPSASVTLVVAPSRLDPIAVTVTADASVTAPDPAAAVIPAERRSFPLTVSGSFPATGVRVTETVARGVVRWQNCDPTRSYAIPAGTTVRTKARVAFTTDEAVFLPVAILTGRTPKLTCQTRDVGVSATAPGTAGNVPAGAISVVPAIYNDVVVRVSNPAATEGGTRTETPLVAKQDVDAALAALTKQLDAALGTEVEALAAVAGGPTIVFAETASRSEAVAEPAPATLVGTEVDTFSLALAATGSVLAVDPSPVDAIVRDRLSAAVPAGLELLPESVAVEVGPGTVGDGSVSFDASATGWAVRRVDPQEVRAAVAGKALADARAALAPFGAGTVEVWPEFVATLPAADSERLTVDVTYEGPP